MKNFYIKFKVNSDDTRKQLTNELIKVVETMNSDLNNRVIMDMHQVSSHNDTVDNADYAVQTKIVLKHIQRYGSITSLTAFQMYNITRLSHAIYMLRKSGYKIKTTLVYIQKNKKRYGRYHF